LEQVKNALEEKLNRRFKKDPRLKEHNYAALELGAAAVNENAQPQEEGYEQDLSPLRGGQ
ncbi:MAG: hypothetical protein GX878_10940, partial [Firmicutes bacterium]|nr:hypothetical protein [Bacillota bacterium]